jgi:hypothetical protein
MPVQCAPISSWTPSQFTDSSIACWDAKFYYHFWRPYTAIRNGDTDGNDATAPDPNLEERE